MYPEFNFGGQPTQNSSPQEFFDLLETTLGLVPARTPSPEEVSRSQLEAKKRERAIKNRLSAQQSRERKRRYAEDLEEARGSLEHETRCLRARVDSLETEKHVMSLEIGALRNEVQQLKLLLFNNILRNRTPSSSSSSSSDLSLTPVLEERAPSGSTSDISQYWVWRGGASDSTLNNYTSRKLSVRLPSVSNLVDNLLAIPEKSSTRTPSRLSVLSTGSQAYQARSSSRRMKIKSEPTVVRPRIGSVFGLVGNTRSVSFPLTKAQRKIIRQQRRLTLQARDVIDKITDKK